MAWLLASGFWLLASGVAAIGAGGEAHAASLDDTTPAEALADVDLVVEAEVLSITGEVWEVEDERVPVQLYDLLVTQVFAGTLAGDRLRLVLPGGEVDGLFVEFSGTPTLVAEDAMLAALHSNGDDIVRIDRWKTGWFLRSSEGSDAVVTTAWRDPVVSLDCYGAVQIARPWSEARSRSMDGPAVDSEDAATTGDANPLFVDDPEAAASAWTDFLDAYRDCVSSVAPAGAHVDGRTSADGGAE